jgi:N utilization substance protein B
MSKVSQAVLRLAVYEMFYEEEIPASVSINEAVELAKKFATEEDASFINGILGSVFKNHTKQEAAQE